jgi:hypothetical protein
MIASLAQSHHFWFFPLPQLQPGDVLLCRSEHVVIFGGWSGPSHYIAYEETRPGEGTVRRVTPYPYWYHHTPLFLLLLLLFLLLLLRLTTPGLQVQHGLLPALPLQLGLLMMRCTLVYPIDLLPFLRQICDVITYLPLFGGCAHRAANLAPNLAHTPQWLAIAKKFDSWKWLIGELV